MTVRRRDRDSCRPGRGGPGALGWGAVRARGPPDAASVGRSEPLPRLPLQGAVQHEAVSLLPGRARVRPGPLPHVRRRRPLGQQERVLQELQHPARLQEGAAPPAPNPSAPGASPQHPHRAPHRPGLRQSRRCCEVGKAEGSPECHSGQRENGGLGGSRGPRGSVPRSAGPFRWWETHQ